LVDKALKKVAAKKSKAEQVLSNSSANKRVATGVFETAKADYASLKNPVKAQGKQVTIAKVSSSPSTEVAANKITPVKSIAAKTTARPAKSPATKVTAARSTKTPVVKPATSPASSVAVSGITTPVEK
jgi:hypothetical protein